MSSSEGNPNGSNLLSRICSYIKKGVFLFAAIVNKVISLIAAIVNKGISLIAVIVNKGIFLSAVIVAVLAVGFATSSFVRNSNYISSISESVSNEIKAWLICIKGDDADSGQNGLVDDRNDDIAVDQNRSADSLKGVDDDADGDTDAQQNRIDKILQYEKQMYELENQLTSTNLLSFIYALLSGILIAISTKRLSDTEKQAKDAKNAAHEAGNISSNVELIASSTVPLVYQSALNSISSEVQRFQFEWSQSQEKDETEKSEICSKAVTRLNVLIKKQLEMVKSNSDALQNHIGTKSSSFGNQIINEIQTLQQQIASAFSPVNEEPGIKDALKEWNAQFELVKNTVSESRREYHA